MGNSDPNTIGWDELDKLEARRGKLRSSDRILVLSSETNKPYRTTVRAILQAGGVSTNQGTAVAGSRSMDSQYVNITGDDMTGPLSSTDNITAYADGDSAESAEETYQVEVLNVSGTDPQINYDGDPLFNANGNIEPSWIEGGVATEWDMVEQKPFESIGSGLTATNGTLSANVRTDTEIRGLFSADPNGDLTYNESTGEFSVTTFTGQQVKDIVSGSNTFQTVAKEDDVGFNSITTQQNITAYADGSGTSIQESNYSVDTLNIDSQLNFSGTSVFTANGKIDPNMIDGGVVTDWVDITNNPFSNSQPSDFAGSGHGHIISDITDLQTELDSKIEGYNVTESDVTSHASALTWTNLGIAKGDVSASDVGLGNVDNKSLSNVVWTDLGISKSDVSASDVGLGNVDNKALSDVGWTDLGIAKSDVGKSDVGLGSVYNYNIFPDSNPQPLGTNKKPTFSGLNATADIESTGNIIAYAN